jgi:nucleoside-diphosphate-sugar epimerase
MDCGYEVINVDCAKPRDESKVAIWKNCSILDANALHAVFREFQPQLVVHLAAYASMEARSLEEFRANTDGTANVLNACKESAVISR